MSNITNIIIEPADNDRDVGDKSKERRLRVNGQSHPNNLPLNFFIFFNFFCYFLYLFFTFPTNSLRTFSLPFSTLRPPPPWIFYLSFISPKNFPWRFSLSLKMWEAYSRWAKWTLNNEHFWQCHVVQHFGENAGPERQNDWKTRKIAKNWHFFFSYLVT